MAASSGTFSSVHATVSDGVGKSSTSQKCSEDPDEGIGCHPGGGLMGPQSSGDLVSDDGLVSGGSLVRGFLDSRLALAMAPLRWLEVRPMRGDHHLASAA